MKKLITLCLLGMALPVFGQIGLTTNGGFEIGDTSGWASFVGAPSTFGVNADAATGSWAGLVTNLSAPSGAVIKQANLGIGQVAPGQEVTISFKAKGDFQAGGVLFAEFFSEIDGGGTSSAEILSGGPLFVASESVYQTFNFTATAGPDVSAGVTLQFNVATGGDPGSVATAYIDDVSVTIVPEPSTYALVLGLGSIALLLVRRRLRNK